MFSANHCAPGDRARPPLPFLPKRRGLPLGYKAVDAFAYRQEDSATPCRAGMRFFELRSGAWKELRLPIVTALVFNGLSFVITVLDIIAGDPSPLVNIIGVTSLFTTVGIMLAWRRPE